MKRIHDRDDLVPVDYYMATRQGFVDMLLGRKSKVPNDQVLTVFALSETFDERRERLQRQFHQGPFQGW